MQYSATIRDVFAKRLRGAALFSLWTHFPDEDRDAEQLALATARFQCEFDLDLVKTCPNGMYVVEDFGLELDFSGVRSGGTARVVATPYRSAGDWSSLPGLDIEQGALGRELRSLRLLRRAIPDVPILFTVFSPMTIASKLSRGGIFEHVRQEAYSGQIHRTLGTLADIVRRYAQAAIDCGADGIFYAHQDTGRHLLSYDDFSEFVAPYDLEALTGARRGRFNVLHLHGTRVRFREVRDYPVHALNWHHWETLPSAAAGSLTSGKCVLGGIDRMSVSSNDLAAIEVQIASTLDDVGRAADLIIAPNCTLRAGFEPGTLHAIRDMARRLSRRHEEAYVSTLAS